MSLTKVEIEHQGSKYPLFREHAGAAPLAKDLDVAHWLGYDRPRDIRKLIGRLTQAGSLGEVFCATVAQIGRGRPAAEFFLTEAQALMVAARSDTPRATEVLQTIIEVFIKAMRSGDSAAVAEVAELRAEVAAMRASFVSVDAIEAAVSRAVANQMTGVLGPGHAKQVLSTIRQHADSITHGADRKSREWNRVRTRQDIRLRTYVGYQRGPWSRCPESIGRVDNGLRFLGRDIEELRSPRRAREPAQLKLVPPTPAISRLP